MYSNWLHDLLPSPDGRQAMTAANMSPVFLCYYSTALLVLIPDTFHVRLALLPFTIWIGFRTMTTLDFVATYNDLRYSNSNQALTIGITIMILRAVQWTFCTKPLKRIFPGQAATTPDSVEGKPDAKGSAKGLTAIAVDAVDLCLNFRGIGWDWSTVRPPPFTRSTESRARFVLAALLSALTQLLALDIFQYIIQVMSPSTFGSHAGGTILDPSLPPLIRYTRSTFITLLGGMVVYYNLALEYDILACIGIVVFGQDLSQWPPMFDAPFRSTSLVELWGKRWHQGFRSTVTSIGGKPLSLLFGPIGNVFGSFLVSAIVHDLGIWGLGRGTDFWYVGGYFLIMAVGIVLERAWKAATGRKVEGTIGQVWAIAWTVGWGNLLIDAWFRRGVAACSVIAEDVRPSKFIERVIRSIV